MSLPESQTHEWVVAKFPYGSYVKISRSDCRYPEHVPGSTYKVLGVAMSCAPLEQRYLLRLEDRSLVDIENVEPMKKQKTEI